VVINTLFFDAVWGGLQPALYGEVRAFKQGRAEQLFTADKMEAMGTALRLATQERMDVYFGVLPRITKRGTAEQTVKTTHVLWADFDAKRFRGKTGISSAFTEIANMRLTPHIIVDSGNGYHAYWMLDGEYDFVEAQKVMKGIERVHHTDHCSDAARILRVPGTLNFKEATPKPVRLVRFDPGANGGYPLDAFYEYAYLDSMTKRPALFYNGYGEWTPSREDATKFGEGQRNNGLARLAAAMVHKGLSPVDVLGSLLAENDVRCVPPLGADEVLAIAKSVERYRGENGN
jgi:hypothetical protein